MVKFIDERKMSHMVLRREFLSIKRRPTVAKTIKLANLKK